MGLGASAHRWGRDTSFLVGLARGPGGPLPNPLWRISSRGESSASFRYKEPPLTHCAGVAGPERQSLPARGPLSACRSAWFTRAECPLTVVAWDVKVATKTLHIKKYLHKNTAIFILS